jgi:4-hydroxybenzoate polyprenyltransferase
LFTLFEVSGAQKPRIHPFLPQSRYDRGLSEEIAAIMDQRVAQHDIPLAVDLDGTLIAGDLLWEALVMLLKRNPLYIFLIPFWALQGAAALKEKLSARVEIDAECLPYRADFLAFLKCEREKGRRIYLATGSPRAFADKIAAYLGIFDGIFATEGGVNLTSSRKRAALDADLGPHGYDYAGNSHSDIAVFEGARAAIVVSPDRAASKYQEANNAMLFSSPEGGLRALVKMLRVHQWAKNALVAVPAVLANDLDRPATILACILAFAAFSLAASAIYILNDLIDLPLDRRHATKRKRSIASGAVSIPVALVTACALAAASAAITLYLPVLFAAVLGGYVVLTTAYSFALKRMLLIDVLTLAGLYTVRVIAGAAASQIDVSFWLLAFSVFFFLSLALVKRFVELDQQGANNAPKIAGRGYRTADKQVLSEAGIASAFASALVLALYIDSNEVQKLYGTPWLIWPLCPVVLYLSIRIWVLARRGEMHEDPVVFLLSDWRSVMMVGVGAALIFAASL